MFRTTHGVLHPPRQRQVSCGVQLRGAPPPIQYLNDPATNVAARLHLRTWILAACAVAHKFLDSPFPCCRCLRDKLGLRNVRKRYDPKDVRRLISAAQRGKAVTVNLDLRGLGVSQRAWQLSAVECPVT